MKPATLLAEPLLESPDDNQGRLGMHPTHLVPTIIRLGIGEIHSAPLHLTPYRLILLLRLPFRSSSSLPLPFPPSRGDLFFEVDLVAELEAALRGGRGAGGGGGGGGREGWVVVCGTHWSWVIPWMGGDG